LAADNIVDDINHVCRAQTSIHLAEQSVGHRNFIRCTLPEILIGAAAPRASSGRICIFSPFGLGILDIAVSNLVYSRALIEQRGNVIESFYTN
jgi:ornithine cyclodeaminase